MLSTLLTIPFAHAQQPPSPEEVYAYEQGRVAAERLQKKTQLTDEQIKMAIEGFSVRLNNQNSAYSDEEIRHAIEHHHEQKQFDRENLALSNAQAGETYLQNIESDADYHFTDYGLAYRVNHMGEGQVPTRNSQVQLKHIGRHLDGSVFDRNDQSAWYPLQNLLPGWRIALMNMPAGSHWTLIVPPHLAYGEHGAGEHVGPQETLIYDLQLLNVR